MKLKPEQLDTHLRKGLRPVYFITGDEPLQLQEAADAVRAAAREQGFGVREVFNAERGFDWNQLLQAAGSMSLFGDRRLIDLRINPKPGDIGAKALGDYAANPPDDAVLLVTCGKVDGRAKWVRGLESAGVLIQIWPLDREALPAWIQGRLRGRGLQPAPDAVALLADRVEGNLLAAAQEIEKLALLHGPGRLAADDVLGAVADSARFDVFGFVDTALSGHADRVARMLQTLRGEGVAPALVSWALGREIRGLASIAADVADGEPVEKVMATHKVWDRRKPLLRTALKRRPLGAWLRLAARAGHVERVVKGAAVGHPWDELLELTLDLSGVRLFPPRPAVHSV